MSQVLKSKGLLEEQWLPEPLHLPTAKLPSDPGEADGCVCYCRVSRQHWKCCPLLPFQLRSQSTTTPSSKYSSRNPVGLSLSMTPHSLPAKDSTHPSWKLSSAIAPSIRVTLGTRFYSNYWNRSWQSINQYIWGQLTEYLMWGIFSGSWVRAWVCSRHCPQWLRWLGRARHKY